MRSAAAVLMAILLGTMACTAPDSEAVVPAEAPEAILSPVPSQVKRLSVSVDGGKVRLRWKPVPNADGYLVYRKLTGPAKAAIAYQLQLVYYGRQAAAEGEEVANIAATSYVDTPQPGNAYTYTVAAYNGAGVGPLSEPVAANLSISQEKIGRDDFVAAPDFPVIGGKLFGMPTVVTGGEAGVTTVTHLTTGDLPNCVAEGVELAAIRPATQSLLPVSDQTFAATFHFNLTEPETFTFAIGVWLDEYPQLLYWEEFEQAPGCGSHTFTHTLRVIDALPPDTRIVVVAGSRKVGNFFIYQHEARPWLKIVSSTPAAGGVLSGNTPLSVTVEYRSLPPGDIQFFTTGQFEPSVTAVTGTGRFTTQIPVEAVCGQDQAYLILEYLSDDYTVYRGDYLRFAMEATGTVGFQALSRSVWLDSAQDFYGQRVYLGLTPCDGDENRLLTLTPSFGRMERTGASTIAGEFGAPLTGPIGDTWSVILNPDDAPGTDFATYPLTITLATSGYLTAVTVDVNTYRVYWKAPPPESISNAHSFAISVTGVNLPPAVRLAAVGPSMVLPLVWNGSEYAGVVPERSCGQFDMQVRGGISSLASSYSLQSILRGEFVLGPWSSTTIASSPLYALDIKSQGGMLVQEGKAVLGEITVTEACGRSVPWEIVSAPSWVRFESLSGNTPGKLGMVLDEAEAQKYGMSAKGMVYFATPFSPNLAKSEVSYAY